MVTKHMANKQTLGIILVAAKIAEVLSEVLGKGDSIKHTLYALLLMLAGTKPRF